jgi:hypothetical protein
MTSTMPIAISQLPATRSAHEQCPTQTGGALSPEDNDAPEVGGFATSLRRIDLATFPDERNAALDQLN